MTAALGAILIPVGTAGATAVPTGFQSSSTSWLTPTTGVVLGYAPCPQTTWCPALLATDDAGATWHSRTPPPIPLPDNGNQVDILLAGPLAAIANDGVHIQVTRDGARHWSPVAIPGLPDSGFISRIAVAHGQLYAVASTFGTDGATKLYSGSLYASALAPVPGVAVTASGGISYGDVSTRGGVAQVRLGANLATAQYWISLDGTRFQTAPVPCPVTNSAKLAGIVQRQVIALCVGDGGDPTPGSNPKQWTSAPAIGQPFTLGGKPPLGGETTDFAAASATSATVSAEGGDVFFLYSTFDGGATWTTTLADDQIRGVVFGDLSFVTPSIGFVQVGQPNTFGSPPVVYRTDDGGHTWHPLPVG
ncbi:MAG TPA: hypothetical protein VGD84_22375 [Pseudonocardiaceae bacterium]